MNSLSFLSKQFDVLASTSVPHTPASTPTGERFSQLGEGASHGMSHPQLKRSQTWSARSFFIPPPSQSPYFHQRRTPPPTRSRRRSGSTPNSARYPVGHSTVSFPSSTASASSSGSTLGASNEPSEVKDMRASFSQPPTVPVPVPPVIQPKLSQAELSWYQRLYIIRLLCLFVNWLWTGFSAVARAILRHGHSASNRNGKQKAESEEETSGDEKESEDDFNVTARLPARRLKRTGLLRARTSSIASIVLPPTTKPPTPQPVAKPPTPSPLSNSYTPPPPTLTVTPYAEEEMKSNQLDLLAPALPITSTDSNLLHPSQAGFRASSTVPALSIYSTSDTSSSKSQKTTPLHRRKTLVLDLDETLIHSTTRPLYPSSVGSSSILDIGSLIGFGGRTKKAGHMVEVVMGGRSTLYHVYKRPFVDYFLRKVCALCFLLTHQRIGS